MHENHDGNRVAELRRQRLCEQVADHIQQDILLGHLGPGESLPTEKVLVGQFGVSRTVVREAMNKLSTKGLIHVTHGKGAVVTTHQDWNVVDATLLRGMGHSLLELLELRKILEVEAAGLAAERAADGDLQRVGEALQRYEDADNDLEKRVQADIDFHGAIIRATRNRLLATVLAPVSDLLRSSRMAALGSPRGREKSRIAHRRIWEAIEVRDGPRARQAMRRHLDEVAADFEVVGIR